MPFHDLPCQVDAEGQGPLYHAAFNGDADSVQLLLESGAHADLKAHPGSRRASMTFHGPATERSVTFHDLP